MGRGNFSIRTKIHNPESHTNCMRNQTNFCRPTHTAEHNFKGVPEFRRKLTFLKGVVVFRGLGTGPNLVENVSIGKGDFEAPTSGGKTGNLQGGATRKY